jgi:hypothetical protein
VAKSLETINRVIEIKNNDKNISLPGFGPTDAYLVTLKYIK